MSDAVRTFPQPIVLTAPRPVVPCFALSLVGLGIVGLVFHDFAMVWQPVPAWVPGRTALACAAGLLMITCGIALFTRAAAIAMRVLFVYLFLWTLLKVPALFVAPQIEGVWLGFGELGILFAGGWTLFARLAALPPGSRFAFLAGARALRVARLFFGASIIPIGLGHLFYVKETLALVPVWMPWRGFWGDFTGVAQMLCGIAVLLSIYPRIAAHIEAVLIALFTLFVWVPPVVAAPTTRLPLTAFFISWVFAAAAWAVADSTPPHGIKTGTAV